MKRINPYRLFTGAFLPNWLLVQPEISAMAKIVYARLAQFAGQNGCAYPKQPTLAKSVGCPVRNLQRYLDELKHEKLIECVQQGLGKPNLYYFLWHPWMDMGEELSDHEIVELNEGMTPVTPKMAEPDMPSMAPPIKGGRESLENTPPTPSRGSEEDTPRTAKKPRPKKVPQEQPVHAPEMFQRFYQAYPKHKNPDDAIKAWDALCPDEALQATIIENVIARARGDPEWLKDRGQFVPYPSSYLRKGRWRDEWQPIKRSGGFVE